MSALAQCHLDAFDEDAFNVRSKRHVSDLRAVLAGASTRNFMQAMAPSKLSASARRDHAVYWLLEAARRDDVAACADLASFLFRCGDEFRESSIPWYRRAAELGDLPSTASLGRMLWYGAEGLHQDRVEAERWLLQAYRNFELAAAQNDAFRPHALVELGQMHLRGEAVARNLEEAVRCWERAAAQGHTYAMRRLGSLYADGIDVAFDADRATHWFEQALAHGAHWAKLEIARLRETCTQREHRAALQHAALAGDAVAAIKLARQFEIGSDGCDVDLAATESWLRQAAGRGHPLGMLELGKLLAGRPDLENRRIALAWMHRARSEPFASVQPVAAMLAGHNAVELASGMSADDLVRVDQLVASVQVNADGLLTLPQ